MPLYNPWTRMYHLYRVGTDSLMRFRTFGLAEPPAQVTRCGTMLLYWASWGTCLRRGAEARRHRSAI